MQILNYTHKFSRGVRILTNPITEAQSRIIRELLVDGRKSSAEIAEKLGLNKEVVKRNYIQLEKRGIITGATIHINYKSFGYSAVAHVLISLDPEQEEKLFEFLQKMSDVYAFYNRGLKGNVGVIVALKTLGQLNDIKDQFKKHFSIFELKTSIWIDVKEMNENLSIIPSQSKGFNSCPDVKKKPRNSNQVAIDEIDKKIADRLAENGRIPMDLLGKELDASTETVKRRYEKLARAGVLKVTIQINPGKLGYQALCVFFASTSKEESDSIVDELCKIPNIISIMKTSGDFDLQIYSMVQDIRQLLFIQEQIGKIKGIAKIELEILKFGEEWTKWPSPRQHISTF